MAIGRPGDAMRRIRDRRPPRRHDQPAPDRSKGTRFRDYAKPRTISPRRADGSSHSRACRPLPRAAQRTLRSARNTRIAHAEPTRGDKGPVVAFARRRSAASRGRPGRGDRLDSLPVKASEVGTSCGAVTRARLGAGSVRSPEPVVGYLAAAGVGAGALVESDGATSPLREAAATS